MPMANVGGVGDAVAPDQWFRSLPIITQHWFGTVIVVTVAANLGIIGPHRLIWNWLSITERFELWRILTCFCYMGPFSMNTLFSVYMLVSFSEKYEIGGPFNTGAGGGTADYAFGLLFAAACILASYPILGPWLHLPPIFSGNLVYFVLYLWSKRNPTSPANIWGVPMTGAMLPFAYLILKVAMGNTYMDLIHGFLVAHIYYFLADVIPQVHGRDILVTPQFLINYFGIGEYRPTDPARVENRGAALFRGAGAAPAARPAGRGYNWGEGGHALGRE